MLKKARNTILYALRQIVKNNLRGNIFNTKYFHIRKRFSRIRTVPLKKSYLAVVKNDHKSTFSQKEKHLLEFHFSIFTSRKLIQTECLFWIEFVFCPIMSKQSLCNGAFDWSVEFQNKTWSQYQKKWHLYIYNLREITKKVFVNQEAIIWSSWTVHTQWRNGRSLLSFLHIAQNKGIQRIYAGKLIHEIFFKWEKKWQKFREINLLLLRCHNLIFVFMKENIPLFSTSDWFHFDFSNSPLPLKEISLEFNFALQDFLCIATKPVRWPFSKQKLLMQGVFLENFKVWR